MFEQRSLLGGHEVRATYALAYDEAVRALEAQRQRFESVRARTGVVFSAAAITTSFFGAQALDGPAGIGAAWIALSLFVLLCGAALAVLWPLEWDGTMDTEALLSDYADAGDPAPLAEVHRDLAVHFESGYQHNEAIQVRVARAFRIACMLLSLEILAWVVALGL